MDIQRSYWNKIHKSNKSEKPQYDLWLDKYESILIKSKNIPIIDLGCGSGNDTLYLKERGYDVISCDFSEEALTRLSGFIDNPSVSHFDLKEGLPFEDNSIKVIISDLSLHYFYWHETQNILKDIERVLMDNGILLCRVNSTKDLNYGAGEGIKLEENFYNINGKLKRFFDREQLNQLFSEWVIININECEIFRYENKKIAWEFAAKKPARTVT